jgi:hypothetical protein
LSFDTGTLVNLLGANQGGNGGEFALAVNALVDDR